MTVHQYLCLIIGFIVLAVIAFLIVRHYSNPIYRIVETTIGDIYHYRPQVKLKGVWFNISRRIDFDSPQRFYIETGGENKTEFLSPDDALVYIEEFKRQNKFTIPSNRELANNQKSIYIE